MPTLTDRFNAPLKHAWESYAKFSPREKGLVLLGFVVVCSILAMFSYDTISGAFANQLQEIAKAEHDMAEASKLLEDFVRLQGKKASLESKFEAFENAEAKQGTASYLEAIAESKAKVAKSAFSVSPQAPRPFGNGFEIVAYPSRFATSSLPDLLEFLREIAHGPRPLIFSSLKIQKNRNNTLTVDLGISSIRPTK